MVEADGRTVAFGMEACTETGSLGDKGKIARSLIVGVAVVVDETEVLIEADVEFPLVGQLSLDGADATSEVEFAHGGVVGGEVDEGVEVKIVEGACGFAEFEIVVVVAVGEVEVEVREVVLVALLGVVMDGSHVVNETVADAHLEAVWLGGFLLAGVEAVDTEHLARKHTVDAAHGVEGCAEDLTHDTAEACLGVVEEDVGGAMGNLADGCSSDACGEEVVDGRSVGLAEEFPCERTDDGVEDGHAIRKPVFARRVVEHTAMVGMGELVARVAVVVPHPPVRKVVLDDSLADTRPRAVFDEVIIAEHQCIDGKVFGECL